MAGPTGPTGAFSYIKSGKAIFDSSSVLNAYSIRTNKIETANLTTDVLIADQNKISINGNLNVNGNATFFSNETINQADVSGNLLVGGVLAVAGDLHTNDSLLVSGDSVVSGSAQVHGLSINTIPEDLHILTDASVNHLTVYGPVSTTTLEVEDLSVPSMHVFHDAVVGKTMSTQSGFYVDQSGNLSMDGSIVVENNAKLEGLERVMGSKSVVLNHQIAQNMSIIQNKYIENNLFVEKAVLMTDASGIDVRMSGDQLRQLLALI